MDMWSIKDSEEIDDSQNQVSPNIKYSAICICGIWFPVFFLLIHILSSLPCRCLAGFFRLFDVKFSPCISLRLFRFRSKSTNQHQGSMLHCESAGTCFQNLNLHENYVLLYQWWCTYAVKVRILLHRTQSKWSAKRYTWPLTHEMSTSTQNYETQVLLFNVMHYWNVGLQ